MSDTAKGYVQGSYQRKAGRIERGEAELAAQQIELEQIAREADRKERLARSMASTIASSGASGVAALEGSPLSVLQQSVKAEARATQRDQYMSRLEAMTARYRGKMAELGGQAAAHQTQKAGRSSTFSTMFTFGMSKMGGQSQQPQGNGYGGQVSMNGTGTSGNYGGYA